MYQTWQHIVYQLDFIFREGDEVFGIVVDSQGFKVEFVALNEDKSPQFYELKEGEAIIEDNWQIANSMNKPKRVHGAWVETEPLPPIEPVEPPENKMEVLEQENKLLKAQVEALSQTADFHEELIAEMAMKVYA